MMESSAKASTKYLEELSILLRSQGFIVHPREPRDIDVEHDGSTLCRINDLGNLGYFADKIAGKESVLDRIRETARSAREYMTLLLEGGAEALDSGTEFREALALLCAAQDLGDGGALLAWVDAELESARRFAKTGERTESLVKLDAPLPMLDPAMQLDAVREILQAATQRQPTPEQWQTALNAARMLTEMDGLEDMVLGTTVPDGGFLTTEGLRKQLADVQAALRISSRTPQARRPVQT